MRMALVGSYVSVVGHTWWNYLGKIKRSGLVKETMSLGVGFQVLREECHSQCLLSVPYSWTEMGIVAVPATIPLLYYHEL